MESVNQTKFNEDLASWKVKGNPLPQVVSIIAGTPILGGPGLIGKNGWFKRTYSNLNTHKMIIFTLSFWLFDNWSSDDVIKLVVWNTGTYYIDTPPFRAVYRSSWMANIAGDPNLLDLYSLKAKFIIPHTASDITIQVIHSIFNREDSVSYGIRNIVMLLI